MRFSTKHKKNISLEFVEPASSTSAEKPSMNGGRIFVRTVLAAGDCLFIFKIFNSMPIFFNKVQKVNPLNRTAPKKWYPVLKSTGLVKEKEVAKQVADETTLNPKEAELTMGQLPKVSINILLNGGTVQLGELGSLYLTIHAEGVDTEEEVTAALIKGLSVRFSPSQTLKDALKKAHFVPTDSLSSK
jgi:predicted histone-like DNA-binding protein